MVEQKQVFYEPTGQRWRMASIVFGCAALAVVLLFGTIVWGVVVAPKLPTLGLRSSGAALRAEPPPHPARFKERRPSGLRGAPGGASALRYGFFVNWDDNSFVSLKRNANNLDVLAPEWLHLTSGAGATSADDPAKEAHVRTWLRQHAPRLAITPLINNFDSHTQSWNSAALASLLKNQSGQIILIKSLTEKTVKEDDLGIHLDFEQIPNSEQHDYVLLLQKLASSLHAVGKTLDVSAPADDDAFDYAAIARAADHVVLMVYDEHALNNEAGPIASQGWFEETLDRRFADIPASKIVVAIGSYGYDWPAKGNARELTVQEAWQIASESGAKTAFDPRIMNSAFAYDEEDGAHHQVWYLDAASAFNESAAALRRKAGGLALWRLGSEDPSLWTFFSHGKSPIQADLQPMQNLQAGYDIVYEGDGEALAVTGSAATGRRHFQYDPAKHLISEEAILQFPKALTITRWGQRHDKIVALSFDDGPDPLWTPKILDVLKREHAHATFFMIGANAEKNQNLVRRVYAEGNDIGSHTYTHPNIGEIPLAEARIELNATERLFEAVLGVRPLLFRPPYAEDIEPETIDDARVLGLSTELGYTTLGERVDPNDWQRPGVQAIVNTTLAEIKAGAGNVVLLHDSGGDREQTVAALPQIIETLRLEGYQFVTAHELLNLPRTRLMAPIPPEAQTVAKAETLAFGLTHSLETIMGWLFIIGLTLGMLRFLVVGGFAIAHEPITRRREKCTPLATSSVAVIVPAYNEENVICETIRSLLKSQNLPSFEILVVDDGSKDRTAAVAHAAFADDSRVRVLTKPNGGKASAINYGVMHSNSDVVVVIDADTVLRPNALSLLTRHFSDARIGAVAGNAQVGNRVTWLTKFQALEYITSQNMDRRAYDLLNAIAVVPGAIGAWRRTALLKVGGFAADTLAEDADATMKLVRAGWRVIFEPKAIALTEAPETLTPFLKQRFRWMFGTLQAVFKHRDATFSLKNGALGWVVLPNVFIFQVVFPLVSPFMDAILLWSVLSGVWAMVMHPADGAPAGLGLALAFYAAFQAIELAGAALGFLLDGNADWKLAPFVVLQRFCYRQLLYWTAVRAIIAAIRGGSVGWGKLQRTARLTAESADQSALVHLTPVSPKSVRHEAKTTEAA